MTREAISLAWELHDAAHRTKDLRGDISITQVPPEMTGLVSEKARLLTLTDEFYFEIMQARRYATLLGWSPAPRRSPSLALAASEALENRLHLVSRQAIGLELQLQGATATATVEASRRPTGSIERSAFLDFANAIEVARSRYYRGPFLDLRSGDAGSIALAFVNEASRRVAAEQDEELSSRLCRRILAASVSILPLTERGRYDEEFRAELRDLEKRDQLTHILRVFVRCWTLRRILEV